MAPTRFFSPAAGCKGLPLIPVFVMLVTRRFILGEEARLRARFGTQFDQFAARTRRWL